MELNINKEEICDEPDPGKFENWTQSLDILIASNSGKLAFAAFLQDEYSIENWHFLMEAGKFSKIKNILELKGTAEQLISKFIGAKSETPVNLSAKVEMRIFKHLENGEISEKLFLEAETAIRDLLRFDSYPRFLKSKLYLAIQSTLYPQMSLFAREEAIFQILERKQSNLTKMNQLSDLTIRKKTKRRQSALQIIKTAVKEAKSQKVTRSFSMKGEALISVLLSTGDEFTIEADGNTRAIDALLRLCFRNIPPACSVQWSLTSKNDNISSNWLQLSSASLSGAKIFGEVRVNLTVIFKNTELPEALEVRAKPHKFLSQVIQHVLQKLQVVFILTEVEIVNDEDEILDMMSLVSHLKSNTVIVRKRTISESTELEMGLDGLNQLLFCRGRIENQRGLLDKNNLELPDFIRLKCDDEDMTLK